MKGFKKFIFFFILILLQFNFYSQNFGNEWINYNQQYFHFQIVKTGVHRINFNTLNNHLSNIGVNISSVPHDNFQVFGRENEVSLLIKDSNNNGFLDNSDYIEFYAEKNDGWLDSLVYDSSHFMADEYYSLFNDTINYYFSWSSSINNKRITVETDSNFNNYSSVNYCWKNQILKFNSEYLPGYQLNGLSSPKYDVGEGWAGIRIGKGGSNTEQLNTPNVFTGGPNSYGRINLMSANLGSLNPNGYSHNTKLSINNNLIFDSSYSFYQTLHVNYNLSSTMIYNVTSFKHEISNIGQGNDYQNVASINLNYPHSSDFSNYNELHFGIPKLLNQKQRFTISNLINSSGRPFLYMLDNNTRVVPIISNGSEWEIIVPAPLIDTIICFLSSESNVTYINKINSVNSSGYFKDFNAFQLDSAYIIVTHKSLLSSSRNYAAQRSNQLDTLVVDIEELYHQFSGGIYKNPLAIKRFLSFAMNKWPSFPSHLFLIGKSIRFNSQTTGSRKDSTLYKKNLVPSWGNPSSDNHFAVGLEPNKRGFSVPIGRLSVNNNSAVLNYLSKVIELESMQGNNSNYTIENKAWQKNIAHFAGGSGTSEQVYIKNRLNDFENIIKDTLFGGVVKNFGKNPFTSQIDFTEFQKVQDYLEQGVSIMTFFGHSSSGYGFSQNIDDPSNWNNQGKYPLVIGLGCYSGDVHNPDTNSFSEQLIRPINSGAIAFISTIKQGFTPFINDYTEYLYKNIGKYSYGKSIGQQMLMTIDSLDEYSSLYNWDPIFESNYNGMSLQGDPAIKVNSHSFPELLLDQQSVWTDPGVVDLSASTFDLNFKVFNLGHAFKDSVFIEVKQLLPDGSDTIYSKFIPGVLNEDTITFNIVNSPKSIGQNNFEISIDLPISTIVEAYDETGNNLIDYKMNISSNSINPVWPYNLSIIGNYRDTLRVSTINPLQPSNTYYFEIDTSITFNSPFSKSQNIISIGGVIEATPNNWNNINSGLSDSLFFIDSSVYYWRVRPDSSVIDWKKSSFQYIRNKWGWSQAHFDQFRENDFFNIKIDTLNRKFNFSPTFKNIVCKNFIQHIGLSNEWSGTYWAINGQQSDYGGHLDPAIMVGVIDPNSLDYWKTPFIDNSTSPPTILNPNHCFGQYNGDPGVCSGASLIGRNREHGYFIFRNDNSIQLDSLANLLTNKIPNGYYILVYSYIPNSYNGSLLYNNPLYANWSNDLFSAFQTLGATGFTSSSQADDGFIFFCKKGDPNSAIEVRTDTIAPGFVPSQFIELNTNITSSLENGKITSGVIGPSKNWKTIYWKQNALEFPSADSSRLRVFGLLSSSSTQKTVLIDTIFSKIDSLINISSIDSNFKFLQLEMETYDDSLLTPAQISRWQITYDPIADLALNPKKSWYLDSSVVQEGDSIYLSVGIENVTPFNMDSLLVNIRLENSNGLINLSQPRQDPLRAREVFIDTFAISSKFLNDQYFLWMTANPKINGEPQDQEEQFYFNNILQTQISVTKDNINPILDVTFDGIHILNNDIISPTPHIVIELDDENPFLILSEDLDTSNFQIEIMKPNSSIWEKISFFEGGVANLLWYINETDNKFIIEYDPEFKEDGIYKLRVQGQDRSGNSSGDQPYQIQFEVVLKSSITNIYNYPNPFSSKTHFVFTLTGSEIPDKLDIQILNINGRLIKQINLSEIENIRIGNNITEYFWDGKDDFGDPLANGIYIYRVISKINNQAIEHRSSDGDKAFANGLGKMYLIR